jgi:diguanylate cyclase (GGDEF)-like protein
LADSQEQVGLLVLQYIGSNPEWRPNDLMVLRSLTDQIVLALHNARLRRLVRNLSVTDEKSGLLKRSSYFDVLLSEVRRAQGQSSPTTVMLMHFGKPSALVKEVGHDAVETMMKQIGQIISSHLRQADFAIMYDMTTIAILLADTAEKGALLAIEKLNKVLADIRLPGRDTVPPMTTGIAEAVMRPQFDPTDIVTEVINRVEGALDQALGSTNRVCALPCAFITSAA